MRCPRDSSELQQKVYEATVEVDQCPECSGMFLDKGELETIQRTIEKDHRRSAVESLDSSWDPVQTSSDEVRGPVDCVKCGTRMERRRYGFGSETVIDECPKGCGVWLDGGEINELERFYEESQEDVQIPIAWRIWAAVRGVVGATKR
jgi:Zn-finger nucleic acid-binding protein